MDLLQWIYGSLNLLKQIPAEKIENPQCNSHMYYNVYTVCYGRYVIHNHALMTCMNKIDKCSRLYAGIIYLMFFIHVKYNKNQQLNKKMINS